MELLYRNERISSNFYQFITNNKIKLRQTIKYSRDYNLDIFQTLNQSIDDVEIHNGRVYNKVTKTYPIVIHANGGVGPRTYLNKLYTIKLEI